MDPTLTEPSHTRDDAITHRLMEFLATVWIQCHDVQCQEVHPYTIAMYLTGMNRPDDATHLNFPYEAASNVVVKVHDWDPGGWWLKPRCSRDTIVTAVGPNSRPLTLHCSPGGCPLTRMGQIQRTNYPTGFNKVYLPISFLFYPALSLFC